MIHANRKVGWSLEICTWTGAPHNCDTGSWYSKLRGALYQKTSILFVLMAHHGFYMWTHLRILSWNLVVFPHLSRGISGPHLHSLIIHPPPPVHRHHSASARSTQSITNIQDFCLYWTLPLPEPLSSFLLVGHSLLVLLLPLFQDSFFSPLPFSSHTFPQSLQSLSSWILTTANWLQTHVYLPSGIST